MVGTRRRMEEKDNFGLLADRVSRRRHDQGRQYSAGRIRGKGWNKEGSRKHFTLTFNTLTR